MYIFFLSLTLALSFVENLTYMRQRGQIFLNVVANVRLITLKGFVIMLCWLEDVLFIQKISVGLPVFNWPCICLTQF